MTTEQTLPQLDWSQFSPAAMWRDWIVKSEAQWSQALGELLKDERAGRVLKRQVDEARMAHRQFGEMAQAAMAAAYMPTRADIEAIDERMGRLEDGLAQVSAQVVALREALVAQGAARVTRVPRTRAAPKPARPAKPAKKTQP
jgi:hypothetical protein